MGNFTLPSPFRHVEASTGGRVPLHFERFYRAQLRFWPGRRIRTLELAKRYQEWAERHGAPSLHLRELRAAMSSIGHRAMHSNGTYYCDAAFASDLPGVADNYPWGGAADLIGRFDAIMADLARLRRDLQHGSESQ